MTLTSEVVTLPVADVNRARAFYSEQVGFTLDVDYQPTAEFRVVQLTPPGSACSVQLSRLTHLAASVTSTSLRSTLRLSGRDSLCAASRSGRSGTRTPSIPGQAAGARGWIRSVATMPALPISLTRTAIPGRSKSAATAPLDSQTYWPRAEQCEGRSPAQQTCSARVLERERQSRYEQNARAADAAESCQSADGSDSHKSTTTSPFGCEQHTRRLPSAGFSSGAGP